MIILKRKFETSVNAKEQEFVFEEKSELIFFNQKEEIFAIDNWKFKNVKKLDKQLKNFKVPNFSISYLKWNKNLEYLFSNLHLKIEFESYQIDQKFRELLIKRDLNSLLILYKNYSDAEKIRLWFAILEEEFDISLLKAFNDYLNAKFLNSYNLFYLYILKSDYFR